MTDAPSVRRRVFFRPGPFAVTLRVLLLALAVAAATAGLGLWGHHLDLQALHDRADRLPWWLVLLVLTLLPMIGFPVSVLHVAAGVRFGIGPGMLAVAATTLLHHFFGWALVNLAPGTFEKRLESWRQRFPKGTHVPMILFCCLMPGIPYSVQLYLLPLIGVPLRLLLTLSTALHTLRAVVSVTGGDFSNDLTPGKIAALACYYVVLFTVCGVCLRTLRARYFSDAKT
ncbi:hypothetical protein OpiT1DRAFT_00065 [Opitutaceae bacterium TAV1]|nr:hypothetical protein OpiT1DRAFT_00065 [Opitutaceae bacterium TAV1]